MHYDNVVNSLRFLVGSDSPRSRQGEEGGGAASIDDDDDDDGGDSYAVYLFVCTYTPYIEDHRVVSAIHIFPNVLFPL